MRKATEPTYKLHIPLADDDYERLVDVKVLIDLLDNAIAGGGRSKTNSIELTMDGLNVFLGNLSDTLADIIGNCSAASVKRRESLGT